MEEILNKESQTGFCKMHSNNQITIPKTMRRHFGIDNLKGEETVTLEVKVIRVLQLTEERDEANE